MAYVVDIFPYAWDNAQCLVSFLETMPRTVRNCKAFQYPFVKHTLPYLGNWVKLCFDTSVCVPEATTHHNLGLEAAHHTQFGCVERVEVASWDEGGHQLKLLSRVCLIGSFL